MNLNELTSSNVRKDKKRIGRGHGSGWGKTAGKGHNGQKQRSGKNLSPAFEGGQMPLIRRIPKRGFSNSPFKKDFIILNLRDIVGKFEDGEEVSLSTLVEKNIVKNPGFILNENKDGGREYKSLLKVIGEYELTKKLNFKVEKISKTTREIIEKAGGTVELLEIRSYANVASNNKKEN